MEPSSSSQRKRHSSSSSSTTSSTSTSSNNEEDLGPPATKQPKMERNSDYPSFHSQQKSSTSTTDSEGESSSEGGPHVRGRDRRKRALCDEDEGPKKPVPSYSSFSMKMMASMGYKPGQGLGRDSSGIIAPIEESLQKGRRGLGFNLDGLEKEDVKWEEEEVECEQDPVWLPPCELPVLTEEDMDEWMSIGERKLTINDEILYCDEAVLDRILKGKSVFDSLGDKEFLEARQRSNPFETIKGAIFQNRAAMKMANIDSVFDFMFTEGVIILMEILCNSIAEGNARLPVLMSSFIARAVFLFVHTEESLFPVVAEYLIKKNFLDKKNIQLYLVLINSPVFKEWDANHPERYAGIFHFRFWQFGEWVDVVIDDWLPTQGGQLIYSKSKSKDEFWSALLEKAYAKLAGSYEALSGGLTGDALVDFTGGVSEVFTLQSGDQSGDLADNEEKRKELFDELIRAHEHRAMMSCSIELKEGESPETKLDCGLVKGHAYTITDIRRMKLTSGLSSLFGNKEKLMMIKMRNPWGQKEWNGAWSDSSEEWKCVPKGEKDKMDLKIEDDGEFWMEFSDWLSWFTHCSLCRIINTSVISLQKTWHDATFHSQWRGKTAGGCFNYKDTFLNNPQYSFTLREPEEIMVSCMQKDPRMSKKRRGGGNEAPTPNFPIDS